MTGLELIVKQGNECILYKMMAEGHCIHDYANAFKTLKWATSPQDMLNHFMGWAKVNKLLTIDSIVETDHVNGFKFQSKANGYKLFEIAEKKVLKYEKLKKKTNPDYDEGFYCSYSDVVVIVDLDKNKYKFLSDNGDDYLSKPVKPTKVLTLEETFEQLFKNTKNYVDHIHSDSLTEASIIPFMFDLYKAVNDAEEFINQQNKNV